MSGLCSFFVRRSDLRFGVVSLGLAGFALLSAHAQQQEQHGRKYKPLPPTAVVTINVEKAFNSKPLSNAAVVFQATRDGKSGSMELKTDPEGKASLDILEVGSHIRLQVFAPGYASYATEFDVTTADEKKLLIKLERPREQVSAYSEDQNKEAEKKPGIQTRQQTPPQPPPPPTTVPKIPLTEPPITSKPPVAPPPPNPQV